MAKSALRGMGQPSQERALAQVMRRQVEALYPELAGSLMQASPTSLEEHYLHCARAHIAGGGYLLLSVVFCFYVRPSAGVEGGYLNAGGGAPSAAAAASPAAVLAARTIAEAFWPGSLGDAAELPQVCVPSPGMGVAGTVSVKDMSYVSFLAAVATGSYLGSRASFVGSTLLGFSSAEELEACGKALRVYGCPFCGYQLPPTDAPPAGDPCAKAAFTISLRGGLLGASARCATCDRTVPAVQRVAAGIGIPHDTVPAEDASPPFPPTSP